MLLLLVVVVIWLGVVMWKWIFVWEKWWAKWKVSVFVPLLGFLTGKLSVGLRLAESPFFATTEPAPCPQAEAGLFLDEFFFLFMLQRLAPGKQAHSPADSEGLLVILWIFGSAFLIGGAWDYISIWFPTWTAS